MSDFPRGWTLSVNGGGTAIALVVPAIAGVVHVLDSFTAYIFNNGTGALFLPVVLLSSSDGVFTNFLLGQLGLPATTAGVDTANGTGLDLAAGPGASLTVSIAAPPAGDGSALVIQGHDI